MHFDVSRTLNTTGPVSIALSKDNPDYQRVTKY